MSVMVGVVEVCGVGLQLREYFTFVDRARIATDWLWVAGAAGLAAAVVAFFGIAWPLLFVAD